MELRFRSDRPYVRTCSGIYKLALVRLFIPVIHLYTLAMTCMKRWLAVVALAIGVLIDVPVLSQSRSSSIFEDLALKPGFAPDPVAIRGVSGGRVFARSIAGRAETATGACLGFVDDKPDHVLVLTDFFDYLSLQIQSREDTTLIVKGPGGTWCNDDAGGKNPGVSGQWLAGTYEIWVGSYIPGKYHSYNVRMTQKRP